MEWYRSIETYKVIKIKELVASLKLQWALRLVSETYPLSKRGGLFTESIRLKIDQGSGRSDVQGQRP